MRQTHRAGEKLFVDYAGPTVPVIDRTTGEIRQAQIFVAVLGASQLHLRRGDLDPGAAGLAIGAHVRAFAFFGGVREIVVPDNLQSGVTKPPIATSPISTRPTPTWRPALRRGGHPGARRASRATRPRSRSGCRWSSAGFWPGLAPPAVASRLAELNQAIRGPAGGSSISGPSKSCPARARRCSRPLERPALRPLPAEPYEFAEWKKARVNIDYHVEVDGHYYSVPYRLVQARNWTCGFTAPRWKCFHHGQRVASHVRSPHRRAAHHRDRAHAQGPSRVRRVDARTAGALGRADRTGTAAVVERILATRRHPQQGFRSCLGILRLGQDATAPSAWKPPASAPCASARCSYKSLALDSQARPRSATPAGTHPRPSSAPRPRQSAWPCLLPLTARRCRMLHQPLLDKLQELATDRHAQGAPRTAATARDRRLRALTNASACWSIGN